MGYTIDDSHLKGTLFSSVCSRCEHLSLMGIPQGKRVCKAFPSGIPNEIWLGINDHTEPYPGDRGITFKQREF